jgi:hypothetical protein
VATGENREKKKAKKEETDRNGKKWAKIGHRAWSYRGGPRDPPIELANEKSKVCSTGGQNDSCAPPIPENPSF